MSSIETQLARSAMERNLPIPIISIAASVFCLAMAMLVSEVIGSVTPSTGLMYASSLILLTLITLVCLVVFQPGQTGKHVAYLILLLGVFYWFASPALGYALNSDRYVGDRYGIRVSRETLARSCTYIAVFLAASVSTYWLLYPRLCSRINSRQMARTPIGLPYIIFGLFLLGMVPYLIFTDGISQIVSSLLAGRTEVRPWKSEGPLGTYRSALYYFCVSGFVAAGGFAGTWGAMMERVHALRRIYLGIFIFTAAVMYLDGGTRSWVALAVVPTVVAWFARALQNRLTIGKVVFLLGTICALQLAFEVARASRHRGWSRDNLQRVDLRNRHFDNDFFSDLAVSVELVPREHGFFYLDDLGAFVTHPIPRFIWRDKPVSSILVFYNDRVHKGYFQKKSGNKLPSSIGQFYMSGGTTGVVILGVLAGLISAVSSGMIRANHMGICHFGSLMAIWWFLMSRGVYPGWTYPLLFNWIILMIGFRSVQKQSARVVMHILQVISHYVPAHRFGGPLQVAHGLGKALVARGHVVSVCTTNLLDEQNDLDVAVNEPVDVDGVAVYYSSTCCSRYWGFSPQLWNRTNALVSTSDVVLVHFHYQFANWAGAYLARRHAKPYAVFAHGSLKVDAISRKGRWRKKLYLRFAERSNLSQANWLFFNAPEEQRASQYASRSHVLPNGVDIEEFDQPVDPSFRAHYPQLVGKLVVLFLGRIDYQGKGLDQLLPAFQRFHAAHPHTHLVLAGPDERGGRAQTMDLVRQLNLQHHVTFTGLLHGAQRIAALRESDIFVLPSPSEGLSISLLEALYVGIPVLVTDRVGFSDRVTESRAGVVARCETESLLDGLKSLANEETRNQMRGMATELVRREYSWGTVTEQLLNVIRQSASQRGDDGATAPSAIRASA